MTEPIFVKRSLLIALMVGVQTIMPPLIALAGLFMVNRFWRISFEDTPPAWPVVVALVILIMVRLPRNLNTEVTWRPLASSLSVLTRWALLVGVLLVLGHSSQLLMQYPRQAMRQLAFITPLILVAGTLATGLIMRRLVSSAVGNRKVIFAGYNESSLALARSLRSNPRLSLQVEGIFDDRSADRLNVQESAQLAGRLSDIPGFARRNNIEVIFIALPIRHVQRVLDLLDDLRDTTASIYYVPDIFVFDLIQARSSELSGIPVVAMCETPFHGYSGLTKRLIDVAISLIFLICALPLLLAIAALVKLSSRGPIAFRQRRYGLDGEEIVVYKFRSMRVTEDGANVRQASRDDDRITPIGRFLRRYSLDELPQFINVLQGRMSLVGPRPHAVAHNEQYRKLIKGYMVRHKVRPGITGLAQVSGARGETSRLEDMEARIRHDLDYLRRWSPLLDFKIMGLTLIKIFKDDQAY